MTDNAQKLGLIAGNRKFPLLFSEAARKKGYYIVAAAIKKETLPKLKNYVDKIFWLNLSDFSRLFEIFKNEGVSKVVMAGQVSPRRLFSKEIARNEELKNMLSSIKDKRAETIFAAIAQKLKGRGFELLDSTVFVGEHLPKKGVLTSGQPDASTSEDVAFGLELAKAVANLGIGQSVAVRDKAIVAVEALEGTDNLIRRAGKLVRGGIVVVKVSKPDQDMRFDIPVVGLNTVKNLIKAGAKCLAIEADKTLFIDEVQSIMLADKYGLSIVAV